MINVSKQTLYNMIFYCLGQSLNKKVLALDYKQESALYSVDTMATPNINDVWSRLDRLISQVRQVREMFDVSNPEVLYVDQMPTYQNGVFYQNSFNHDSDRVDMDQLKDYRRHITVNRKSKTIRFTCEKTIS